MAIAINTLPDRQREQLMQAYAAQMSRRRMRFFLCGVIFALCAAIAAMGAEVRLDTLFSRIDVFTSYFDRILKLDNGMRVWTDVGEWFWGLKKWGIQLGETLLIAYVGTIIGAVGGFVLCFLASENLMRRKWVCFVVRRFLEFCRTVPDLVFALLFVVAFGLGPMPGVMALAIHSFGALGKQFMEVVENIDIKPVEGLRAAGASWLQIVRFAVLPQVLSNFASYSLLRFEINVRGASVMGFVGAGGIGQDLIVSIRKFYYADVSAILVMIIVTVFVIDLLTDRFRQSLLGREARR